MSAAPGGKRHVIRDVLLGTLLGTAGAAYALVLLWIEGLGPWLLSTRALCVCVLATWVSGPAAVVWGLLALRNGQRSFGKPWRHGLAWAGIVGGVLTICLAVALSLALQAARNLAAFFSYP